MLKDSDRRAEVSDVFSQEGKTTLRYGMEAQGDSQVRSVVGQPPAGACSASFGETNGPENLRAPGWPSSANTAVTAYVEGGGNTACYPYTSICDLVLSGCQQNLTPAWPHSSLRTLYIHRPMNLGSREAEAAALVT